MNTLEKLKSNQIQALFSLSKTFLFKFFISAFWFHSVSTRKEESWFPEQELLIAVCSNTKKPPKTNQTKQKKMKWNLILNCYLLTEDWKQHLKQSQFKSILYWTVEVLTY